MNRVILNNNKLNPNFIGSWNIENLICDNLINYFEKNKNKQHQGSTAVGINKEAKDTVDISLNPREVNESGNEVFKDYFYALSECHKDYLEQWPFLGSIKQKYEIGSFNLQRYTSGQHVNKIHCERISMMTLHRVFAFMTYLNDVDSENGGSTYFSHYDLDIQPTKGCTLIWPAEWTHAHRGSILKSGIKYIITGWMNFAQ